MGIDHTTSTDTGAETVEDPKPADRPPPPPEQPGQETEGYPSRLELRKAAATDEQATGKPTEDKVDTNQPVEESPNEQDSQGTGNKPESPTTKEYNEPVESTNQGSSDTDYETNLDQSGASHSLANGHDASDGQPVAEHTGLGEQFNVLGAQESQFDGAFDNGGEQQPSTVGASPAENETHGDERAPTDGISATEIDQPTSISGEGTESGEESVLNDAPKTARTQPAEDLDPSLEQPGPETSDLPSRGAAAAGNTDSSDKPAADDPLGAQGQAEGAAPAQEVPSTPPELPGGTINQPGTEGQPETADESTAATDVQPSDDTSTAPEIGPKSEASAERDADGTTDLPTKLVSEEDDETQVEVALADKVKDSGHRLAVDGKPINEYLDPVGAAARDAAGDRPSIEEPTKPEDDKTSRPERLRKKFYEEVEDAHDVTSKAAQRGQEIFGGHTFGHPETRTSHEVAQTPREGVDAGDAAGALLVTGIVLGELLRWGYMKLKEGREHIDGGNR